ncbi:hypothetical protein D6915_14590 [Escherichia coli]|nr:hypothetical protein [Escherichia coli]
MACQKSQGYFSNRVKACDWKMPENGRLLAAKPGVALQEQFAKVDCYFVFNFQIRIRTNANPSSRKITDHQ